MRIETDNVFIGNSFCGEIPKFDLSSLLHVKTGAGRSMGLRNENLKLTGRGHSNMMAFATRLLVSSIISIVSGGLAASNELVQIGRISIPGIPINQIGSLIIDQATGRGYLADKDGKSVVVFDTNTDSFIKRIGGFVGIQKDANASGPNGLVVVGDELWVSDGDNTIKIIDLKTDVISSTIPLGGILRANGMAYNYDDKNVIVASSNEMIPFLSIVSTRADHTIITRIDVPESAENLERSIYHTNSNSFYTVVPVIHPDKTAGSLLQTDAKSGKVLKKYKLVDCHPHSLQAVTKSTVFLGCSNGHGPNSRSGGNLAIFDLTDEKIVSIANDLGGNGSSDFDPQLARYYHATTNSALIEIDINDRKIVQSAATSNGARSVAVNRSTHRVYLATAAKEGPCGGCIIVFSPKLHAERSLP